MKRFAWLLPIIAIAAWFLLKDITYRAIVFGQDVPQAVASTYLERDGWILLPVETPPGAWTNPWGIDLFVIAPPSGAAAGNGLVGAAVEPAVAEMSAYSLQVEKALALAGPSYSAFYRHPSAAVRAAPQDWDAAREDLAMAFERYLYSKNNWRGVVLVVAIEAQHLLAPLLERIENDPRLLERFGGVVLIGDQGAIEAPAITCSPALDGHCAIFAVTDRKFAILDLVLPRLHRSPVRFEFAEPADLSATLKDRNTKLSIWLDANAPKPAEPLGGIEDMEVIEIAPVRRPGETDEALAERELRKN